MLSSDLDKDDLPDRTYLRPVEGSNIDIDVNANTLIRDGNFFYDLTFDSGLTNSILFLLRQHLLEVVEDEADAKLVIETNKLTATDGTDCSAISAYGDDVFGGIYLYENGK